ncbi:MAG: hypothetical protein KF777_20055 [Planctomycetaceae bacterium]|nr:hypothetical protein [Planctomycetaceae bacterium]
MSVTTDRRPALARRIARVLVLFAATWLVTNAGPAVGQAPAEPAAKEPAPISNEQETVLRKYQRFENTLQQLAEYLRRTDPGRADLVVRVIGKSTESRIPHQMEELVELLNRGQLGDAVIGQEDLIVRMAALLDLLQSEDRQDELAREQERVAGLIRDVDKLIGQQKNVRAVTERGGSISDAERRQQELTERTDGLLKKIDGQDAERQAERNGKSGEEPSKGSESSEGEPSDGKPSDGKPSDGKPADGKPSDGKPSDGKPSDGKPSDGKPSDGKPSDGKPSDGKPSDGKPSDGKPSDGKPSDGKPSDGKPSEGKPSEGQPSEGQPSEGQSSEGESSEGSQGDKTPGRDELEQAKKEMEAAIRELKAQQREKASDQQDKALAELLKAKDRLEEILRQLREEERGLMLAALESRFREMLARHLAVYNGTVALGQIPEERREDRHRARAIDLARQESEIGLMAEKALTLLKDEGSSVSFPEAVEQMRDDLLTVTRRLERADVGELTQALEKDILESLEELILSLQKEMEKQQQQQGQQQQQQGQPQNQALVDQLSELKMLRALQYRINRRTRQLGRLIDGEQASDPDLVGQLRGLADRQDRLREATRNLVTERNQ